MKAKIQDPNAKIQRMAKVSMRSQVQHVPRGGPLAEYFQMSDTASSVGEDGAANGRHAFDLEERTVVFGEAIVRFVKKVPRGPDNNRLIDQLAGCGTSVGANYCEANEGLSRKDFHCIIGRCRKESKETKFFLRMMAAAEPELAPEARELFAKRRSFT